MGAVHLGVDHESQYICDVVECENSAFADWPESLIIGIALLHQRAHTAYVLWIVDGDLQIGALLVPLEAQDILTHRHLNRGYNSRVLIHLFLAFALEEGLERLAVDLGEVHRRGNVEVVEKACYVKED